MNLPVDTHDPLGALTRCDDCEGLFYEASLEDVRRLSMRVADGEPTPAGQCPSRGALCHYVDPALSRTYVDPDLVHCQSCDLSEPRGSDDHIQSTPCGSFCRAECLPAHAQECAICAREFDLATTSTR